MFLSPKLFFRDKFISVPLGAAVVIQGILWWYTLANVHKTGERFFLHYNITFGPDLVGEWWQIFLFPALGLLVVLINFALSLFFYNKDKFLARVLTATVVLSHIFLLIATILIVRLNV
jgi:hypothetical protein